MITNADVLAWLAERISDYEGRSLGWDEWVQLFRLRKAQRSLRAFVEDDAQATLYDDGEGPGYDA